MEKRPRTRFSERGLTLAAAGGDEELDLFAGSLHYWRIARRDWAGCLGAMRELGLEVVTTYVPWSVHERGPGRFDFESKSRDLPAFLGEVARAGMRVLVRPGPHINAELTGFGFPDRVLSRKEVQAVSARSTPVWLPAPPRMFPVPSYASEAFFEEASGWLAAAAEAIAPHLYPDGPVVAVQVDNEMPLFFRLGAYDHDYHPDALAWWREHAGEALEPPRAWDPADAARCVRWVRFKEEYAARALARLAGALEEGGLAGVARFHNHPPMDPALANLPRAARAIGGVCGADFYHTARDYSTVRRRALYLASSARPLPFAVEVGQGGPPWLPPMTAGDQKQVALGLLAAGVRAINFYMAVERERWYDAPLSPEGTARPRAAGLKTLLAALRDLGWTSLRRRARVAVVLSRAEARWALASSVADPLTPVVADMLGLGPAGYAELALDEDAAAYRRWLDALLRALDLAALPYALLDEEALSGAPEHRAGRPTEQLLRGASSARRDEGAGWAPTTEEQHRDAKQIGASATEGDLFGALQGYAAVILPTLSRVDRTTWRRLGALAAGGARVVVGPGRPWADALGAPLGEDEALPPRCGLIREGSLDDVEGLAADLIEVAGESDETWMADHEEVDVSVFEDEDGLPRALFCGNRSDAALETDLVTPTGACVTDVLTGQRFAAEGDDAFVRIALRPFQVRMFALELD